MKTLRSPIMRERKDFLCVIDDDYVKQSKLKKAIVVYEVLSKIYPHEMQYAFGLNYLYLQTKQYEKALEHADKILIENPQDRAFLGTLLKARALYMLGRENEGRKAVSAFFNARIKDCES